MDSKSQAELNSIKRELRAIISELDSISNGIRTSFNGIGNDRCAKSIDTVSDKLSYAKRKLDNINTSVVTEGFAKKL